MDQIRFDFLGSVNGNNGRNNKTNANAADSGDAFAQILDQQTSRRADPAAGRRAGDPRGRSDADDRGDVARPQVLKRRETKTATSAQTGSRTEAAAKPAPKAKPSEKTAAEGATCGKPAAKSGADEADQTAEVAAGSQVATDNTDAAPTTETEGQSDASGDTGQQQPDDNAQQQANDGTDQSETAAASVDMSLLAMLAVPLPLQTLAADATTETTASASGNATALQAALAASLAGSVDLNAAVNAGVKTEGSANAAGLKFGTILNAGLADPQKSGTDVAAALKDAAEELAKAADPLAQPAPDANGKTKDQAGTKARDAAQDKAAATTTPELNAKASAAIVQPMARASAVSWSGTANVRNELAESMAVSAEASFGADDTEFSNWSQFLGSGASGLGTTLNAKQSAFMAQLKQNLQNLPPHEQIAVQIRDAMQNGNSRLTVSLHPAELGRVEVKLDIDKDKNVSATVIVDRPATLDLLRNDAKALERALQDAGLQTGSGSLSFNLRDSNGQNGSAAQNGTGTGGGSGSGAGAGSEARAEVARADVVATADGYVDLET